MVTVRRKLWAVRMHTMESNNKSCTIKARAKGRPMQRPILCVHKKHPGPTA